jgi:hypothetical protein
MYLVVGSIGSINRSSPGWRVLRTEMCCCSTAACCAAPAIPQADVVNRGFSGFNTYATLLALCEITDSFSRQPVLLATVWLGANDAALLGRRE